MNGLKIVKRSDMDTETGVFRAYLDCLKVQLPLAAAFLRQDGLLIGLTPQAEQFRERIDTALLDAGAASECLTATIGDPELAVQVVVLLERPAEPLDRQIFESVNRLTAEGLAGLAAASRAEEAQAYFADALESLPEAIAIFDDQERFVLWNTKFEETYGLGVDLHVGRLFEEHLRACLAIGAVKNAIGREEEWLQERLHRFRAGEGAHEHPLSSGRWVRTQDRALRGGGRIGIRTDITDYIAREQSFRLLFEANPGPMLIIDRDSLEIVDVNDASTAFYGYSREDMMRMRLPDIRPEKADGEIRSMIERLESPEVAQKSRVHVCANGEERVVRVNTRFIEYKGRSCILAAVFDMTDRFRAEEEMQRTRRFLRDVVDHVPVALFVKDMADAGRYVLYNRAGESLFGLAQERVIGNNDAELFDDEVFAEYQMQDSQVLRQGMLDLVEEKPVFADKTKLKSVRLRKVALDDSATGLPRYVLGLAEDVTEQRSREQEISRLALHDSLTGLPNRRLFDERLRDGLAALQPGYMQAVLFLDLDGFKSVNDTFGHPAGDRLLQMVADRLQAIVRPQDTVSRFGGDEFAVTVSIPHEAEVRRIAERIISSLAMPYETEEGMLRVSASVGIAVASAHGHSPQALLSEADAALYQAKRSGKNRFSIWRSDAGEADPAVGQGNSLRNMDLCIGR
jgi:diguanylate cyclase (GGDEF)-like protein/PAS domain S-box-containing protein